MAFATMSAPVGLVTLRGRAILFMAAISVGVVGSDADAINDFAIYCKRNVNMA